MAPVCDRITWHGERLMDNGSNGFLILVIVNRVGPGILLCE